MKGWGGVKWNILGQFGTVLRGNLEQNEIRMTKSKHITEQEFNVKFNTS